MKSFIATTFAITATMAVTLENASPITVTITCGKEGKNACTGTMTSKPDEPVKTVMPKAPVGPYTGPCPRYNGNTMNKIFTLMGGRPGGGKDVTEEEYKKFA